MKTLTFVVTVLVIAACVTAVWAQPQTAPAQPTKTEHPTKGAPAAKMMALTGEIVSVDTAAQTITVKHKSGKTETLKVDSKVTVRKSGKTISLKDLSAGENVGISCTTAAGEKVVSRITVKTPPEKKEAATKKEEAAPKKEETTPAPPAPK
ncbi:MAG: hypothetical protein WCE90_12235 [Candidatus Zixiibacteriota bacterium]